MTDARISTAHAEVEIALDPPAARISTAHAEVDLVLDPPGLNVSRVTVEVCVTYKYPYLQDMPGHFVHTFVGGQILPIRSLKT